MRKSRFRKIIYCLLAIALLGSLALPFLYERLVTATLSRALDARHGKTGWVVSSRTADGQAEESIALVRTLYVALLFPRLQKFTPWSGLQFTHKTTAPNKPWHYAICVISEGRETTYYWSMRQHQWVSAWENNTHNFPPDVEEKNAASLRNLQRRGGVNWSMPVRR